MKLSHSIRTGFAAALLSLALAPFALAGEFKPYVQNDFEAAQKAGEPIVVDIFAPWCPTCKAQEPILEKLAASEDLAPITLFRVDFDSQKDVVRALGATRQSTLIAYHGDTETGRSVGDTRAESIEALFKSALGH